MFIPILSSLDIEVECCAGWHVCNPGLHSFQTCCDSSHPDYGGKQMLQCKILLTCTLYSATSLCRTFQISHYWLAPLPKEIGDFLFTFSFCQHKFWVERTGVSVVAVAPYYIGEIRTQSTEWPTTETPFLGDWADWTEDARYSSPSSSQQQSFMLSRCSGHRRF